jgi:tagaturonate reductase
MAHQNGLEITFIDWLENANHFCNSLVDRIVPGKFNKEEEIRVSAALGYEDDLMIMSEYYVLWAIQSSSEKVKEILSFANEQNGVLIAPNINKFRNLKLKLLNGSHTFTCGLAVLAGFSNVKEAMSNAVFSQYITQLMNDGIVPALLSDDIDKAEAQSFANSVLDRYGNPFIDHKWLSICVQYSAKMNMRCVPQIQEYQQRFSIIHPAMCLGLAAHLLFMKVHLQEDGTYAGSYHNQPYPVTDSNAAIFAAAWEQQDISSVVTSLLGNQALWRIDLLQLPGLAEDTISCLNLLIEKGALATMDIFNKQKSVFTDAS